MKRPFIPYQNSFHSHYFSEFYQLLKDIIPNAPPLISKGDKPLKMSFESQLKSLIFYHLEEVDFVRENIPPKDGIGKSSFSEAINHL